MKCKKCGKDLDPVEDDTLAEMCWSHSPSNPVNKFVRPHSFRLIDIAELNGLRYPTKQEIVFGEMERFEKWEKKFIYPDVKILCEVGNPNRNTLILETYIRLLHEEKYYLCKCFREFEIKVGIESQVEMISCIKHFYSEVYRYYKLMKVDLNMVMPQSMGPDKPVFELDPNQTPEEERLMIKV